MTATAALAGSYSDFKLVKTRAVAQLVIEIPIEQAEAAIKMFGIPMSGTEIPVAVALLVKETAQPKPADLSKSERGKEQYRQMDDMERARVRAVQLCKDLKFQLWASRQVQPEGHSLTVEQWMRWRIGTLSRRSIASDDRTYREFLALETQFKMDTGQMAEAR